MESTHTIGTCGTWHGRIRWQRLRALSACVLLPGLFACSSGPDVGMRSSPLATGHEARTMQSEPRHGKDDSHYLSTLHRLFDVARGEVESELAVDLSTVTLALGDNDDMLAEVTRETERLALAQFGDADFSREFSRKVIARQDSAYVALYVADNRSILINQYLLANYLGALDATPERQEQALLSLLLHELVHAADDARYQLQARRKMNFRASFAESATFEGHAQYVARGICQRIGCLAGMEALEEFMFGPERLPNGMAQPVEAISRNVLEYSYLEGEHFVSELARRPQGERLIDALLDNPPLDPIQILHPESFPDTRREARNRHLLEVAARVEHPWREEAWRMVESSPLKGINLRADPDRREAAIDGFTRLVTAMIALQFYDIRDADAPPVDVSILETDSVQTARLFADSLYRNALSGGALPLAPHETTAPIPAGLPEAAWYRTIIEGDNGRFRSTIAAAGRHVVQVSARESSARTLDAYAAPLLQALLDSSAMSLR